MKLRQKQRKRDKVMTEFSDLFSVLGQLNPQQAKKDKKWWEKKLIVERNSLTQTVKLKD